MAIAPSDGLRRTPFFDAAVLPTIPGEYECATGGGHIFRRTFDGTTWLSSVDNKPTTVRMTWRGVEPGSVADLRLYPKSIWSLLTGPAPIDMNDPNIGALAA
jgi:hypothetical protein